MDADNLTGDSHENLMLGGSADDVLTGKGGADRLLGGADWDKLYGGFGSDTISGGYGYDQMWGGFGKDTFVFTNYKETNSQNPGDSVDIIMDFGTGFRDDVIDLSAIDARWDRAGNQAFMLIGNLIFSGKSGELQVAQGIDTRISGDCNGDGIADFSIRLSGLHDLTFTHFIF